MRTRWHDYNEDQVSLSVHRCFEKLLVLQNNKPAWLRKGKGNVLHKIPFQIYHQETHSNHSLSSQPCRRHGEDSLWKLWLHTNTSVSALRQVCCTHSISAAQLSHSTTPSQAPRQKPHKNVLSKNSCFSWWRPWTKSAIREPGCSCEIVGDQCQGLTCKPQDLSNLNLWGRSLWIIWKFSRWCYWLAGFRGKCSIFFFFLQR